MSEKFVERLRLEMLKNCNGNEELISRTNKIFEPEPVKHEQPKFDFSASLEKNISLAGRQALADKTVSFREQLKINMLADCNGDEDAIRKINEIC